MSLRFRKRIKLLPGVHINLSNRGVSTSLGRPGATVNISKRGVKSTVGLPGTGISYSSQTAPRGESSAQPLAAPLSEPSGSPGVLSRTISAIARGVAAWIGTLFVGFAVMAVAEIRAPWYSDAVRLSAFAIAAIVAVRTWRRR